MYTQFHVIIIISIIKDTLPLTISRCLIAIILEILKIQELKKTVFCEKRKM